MTEDQAIVELCEARRIMCLQSTGPERMTQLIGALAHVLFRAPERWVPMTIGMIREAERRMAYLETGR